MPLKMVWKDGSNKPQIFCDECGGRIESANAGNFLWLMRVENAPTPEEVFFTHNTRGAELMAVFTHGRLETLDPIFKEVGDNYRQRAGPARG